MAIWVLYEDGKEVVSFTGHGDVCREECEIVAIDRDLAAKTKKGIALGPGVEIVCLQDD